MQSVVEDPLGGVRVNSAQHVVEKYVACLTVHGTGEGDALLLATRESDTLLADNRLITTIQNLKIAFQRASHNDLLVTLRVPITCEDNVLLDGAVDKPSLLRAVGNTLEKSCLGVGAEVLAADATREIDITLELCHLSEQRHKKRGLSASSRSNNNVELTSFELNVDIH